MEVPVMRLTPRDLAVLIDRLRILFDRPARINEGRNLSVGSTIPIDALSRLVELTRGGQWHRRHHCRRHLAGSTTEHHGRPLHGHPAGSFAP